VASKIVSEIKLEMDFVSFKVLVAFSRPPFPFRSDCLLFASKFEDVVKLSGMIFLAPVCCHDVCLGYVRNNSEASIKKQICRAICCKTPPLADAEIDVPFFDATLYLTRLCMLGDINGFYRSGAVRTFDMNVFIGFLKT